MKKTEWYQIFSFCKKYFEKVWLKFGIIIGLIITGAIVANATPLFWGQIIDCLTNVKLKDLILYLMLYFGVSYLIYGLGVLEGYLGSKLNYEIESRIKKEVFDKALHMNCDDLDEFNTGELVSRVSSDSGSIITFVMNVITSSITIVINICAALVFSFQISVQLSVVSIAFIPLSILANFLFKKAYRALSEQQKKYADLMSSFLVNTLGHIPETKAYCIESQQNKKYSDLIAQGWKLQKRGIILDNKSSIFSSLISSTSTLVTIILSAILISRGKLTIGNVVSFQAYIGKLSSSISQLLQMNYSAQTASVSVNRIKDMFDKATDYSEFADAPIKIASITFKNVSFSYRNKKTVLNGVNFHLDKPGVYAFVGENGCGKTTILKLIMRYYRLNGGTIQFNQRDISDFSANVIRKSIGYFAKDVYIQNDTLLANLLLGSNITVCEAIPQVVIDACDQVGLSDFIDQLPQKYETNVGEDGKLLSSGQCQKIAIVRAILSNMPVLLFDEITSDLDGASEKEIVSILHRLGKTKIVILVTHRINSVYGVKKIMVIKNGCITAFGTHDELFEISKEYRNLFEQ